MKARIKQYFTISKKEWNGLVVLVILIAGVLAAPYVYHLHHKDSIINFKDFDKDVAELKAAQKRGDYQPAQDDPAPAAALFNFDPNKASMQQWRQLGLSAQQASVINHYVQKGGHFYRKEDLRKVYSITESDYQRLAPYIYLPASSPTRAKLKAGETVELNSADSAKLTMLPGVGPSFAVRIIRYRDRLGGFYSKEQLKEVYGIDSLKFDELAKQVTINPRLVTKININSISFNQLRLFPYLNYNQVNAIIQYRTQHGNYTSVNDLKNIAILDERTLQKIQPYLSFK